MLCADNNRAMAIDRYVSYHLQVHTISKVLPSFSHEVSPTATCTSPPMYVEAVTRKLNQASCTFFFSRQSARVCQSRNVLLLLSSVALHHSPHSSLLRHNSEQRDGLSGPCGPVLLDQVKMDDGSGRLLYLRLCSLRSELAEILECRVYHRPPRPSCIESEKE